MGLKLFTIATVLRRTTGHGSSELVHSIEKDSLGSWPPVYSTKELAESHLNLLKKWDKKIVVELEFVA